MTPAGPGDVWTGELSYHRPHQSISVCFCTLHSKSSISSFARILDSAPGPELPCVLFLLLGGYCRSTVKSAGDLGPGPPGPPALVRDRPHPYQETLMCFFSRTVAPYQVSVDLHERPALRFAQALTPDVWSETRISGRRRHRLAQGQKMRPLDGSMGAIQVCVRP